MKKLLVFALVALGVFAISACSSEEASDYDYVMVDINPSITFIIDEDGKVDSFVLNNEDAEIVAVDLELIGLDVEDALELYLDAAIEAGYIDVDAENNAIFVTTDEDEDEEDSINERIRGRAEQFMQERGIGAAIIRGKIDDELRERAEDLEIGPGRLRLIETAVDIDEDLTLEEALELDMREIMEIVRGSHQERMQAFQQERREAARETRDALIEEARERVEAHRAAVEAGDIELPDFDAIREEFRENAREKMESYRERAQERRDNMRP